MFASVNMETHVTFFVDKTIKGVIQSFYMETKAITIKVCKCSSDNRNLSPPSRPNTRTDISLLYVNIGNAIRTTTVTKRVG